MTDLKSITNTNEGFDNCPFCGGKPDVTNIGTFIDIECCASMSLQKSDMMEYEVRQKEDMGDDPPMFRYEIEKELLDEARKIYNTRV